MKLKILITCLKMIVGGKTRNVFFNMTSQEHVSWSICIAKAAANSEIKLIRFTQLRCCKMQATIVLLLPCFCEFKLRRFLKIIELIFFANKVLVVLNSILVTYNIYQGKTEF